jgi:caa(3)-type oxidase subunit IV
MADSTDEIRKKTKTYLAVGAVLFAGTLLTVAVATQEALDIGVHGFDTADCILGLLIATVKSSLVAAIFMHLNHEKKMIYWIFFGSFVFVFFLAWLLKLAHDSPIVDQFFYR